MGQVRKNMVLYDFADSVRIFISENKMPDLSHSLIMDYLDILDKKGVDLKTRDVESEIYNFYIYYSKLHNVVEELGEDEFIELITNQEILKNHN